MLSPLRFPNFAGSQSQSSDAFNEFPVFLARRNCNEDGCLKNSHPQISRINGIKEKRRKSWESV
jgi:hypothetical protein